MGYYKGNVAHAVGVLRAQLTVIRDDMLDLDDDDIDPFGRHLLLRTFSATTSGAHDAWLMDT
eukprot:461561-Prorocentrum_lima.AAC.1